MSLITASKIVSSQQRVAQIFALSFATIATAFASNSFAEEVLVPQEGTPKYEVSNLRAAGKWLIFDYKRTSDGTIPGEVIAGGMSKEGVFTILGLGALGAKKHGRLTPDPTGELKFLPAKWRSSKDIEVFLLLYVDAKVEGQNMEGFLISNVSRIGNPGPETKGRPLTDKEAAAFARYKLQHTLPGQVPSGYIPVTAKTSLAPGMPVKAGYFGQWEDAEVLSFDDKGKVLLKYPSDSGQLVRKREGWIAVDPSVEKKAASSPSQFKLSENIRPGRMLPAPEGYVLLNDEMELAAGTPLLYETDKYFPDWGEAFLVDAVGDEIKMRGKNSSASWDKNVARNRFLISKETLELLNRQGIEEKFAENIGLDPSEVKPKSTARKVAGETKSSLSTDSVAAETVALEDVSLRTWTDDTGKHKIEARYVSQTDTGVTIKMETGREVTLSFEKLSAGDRELASAIKAAEEAGTLPLSTDQLKQSLRTWTDDTGKHRIEAKYVSHDDIAVTLITDTGREMKLPLEKLSAEDRELVAKIK